MFMWPQQIFFENGWCRISNAEFTVLNWVVHYVKDSITQHPKHDICSKTV